jgi:hypothetical protein
MDRTICVPFSNIRSWSSRKFLGHSRNVIDELACIFLIW